MLHLTASSGTVTCNQPGVADDISFEAPLRTKAFIVAREGPSPSHAVARAWATPDSDVGTRHAHGGL